MFYCPSRSPRARPSRPQTRLFVDLQDSKRKNHKSHDGCHGQHMKEKNLHDSFGPKCSCQTTESFEPYLARKERTDLLGRDPLMLTQTLALSLSLEDRTTSDRLSKTVHESLYLPFGTAPRSSTPAGCHRQPCPTDVLSHLEQPLARTEQSLSMYPRPSR
ncbi:hypothetical protein PMIN02_012277 [Paraphaeosphaeria minitans]